MIVRRIKINLNNLYSDYRKLAYITIDSKWNLVIDLEQHIKDLFGIDSSIYLTTDDGILIPARENIDIISLENSIVIHLLEHHDEPVPTQNKLDASHSSNEDVEVKQKRKRKRKRKNKQVLAEVNQEIAEENGFDEEYEDVVEKRVAKLLKKRNTIKEEVEVIVEPIIKEIPKLSIISSLPKIVYGF